MRLPGRPAPAPTHATESSSRGVGHGVRAVAVVALACAALMGVSATAQAQTEVWSATLTVKELSPNSSTFGCTNTTSSVRCSDFLSDDEFTYDSTDYAITAIFLTRNAQLQLHFDTDLTTAAQTLTVEVDGTTFAFEDAHVKGAAQRSWSRSGLSWSAGDAVALRLTEAVANTPATGNPFIIGMPTPQVGQSLSASVGNINDADGTTNIVVSYQWIRVDGATETDITGATTNTYTPVAGDVGKQLKVRASFTDDLGNPESRTSPATLAVQAAAPATAPGVPRTLTATSGDGQVVLTWTVPASDGGETITRYEHRHKVTSATNFPATWTSVGTARTATVGSLTNGTPYSFQVRAVNTVGEGTAATANATPTATTRAPDPTLTLDVDPHRFGEADGSVQICVVPSAVSTQRITVQVATADGTATAPDDYGAHSGTVALQPNQQRACFSVTLVDDAEAEGDETFTVTLSNPTNATLGTPHVATFTIVDNENVAATGTPTISGTAQVGQVLTAEPGPIDDANGLTSPVYRYQWLRADTEVATGTDITGATGRTYTLVAADVGQYLRVRVSFTDDASHQESRTSNATPAVQAAPPPPPPRTTTPGAPTGLTVTSGDRQVTVTWAAVSGATGYTVQWKSGSEAYAASRQQTVTASRTTISGLTNGTTYTVRVRTRHAGGTSAWSAEAMATPAPPAPVPTLPAVAAGLLALLLVGRGMALIRRRLPGQPT